MSLENIDTLVFIIFSREDTYENTFDIHAMCSWSIFSNQFNELVSLLNQYFAIIDEASFIVNSSKVDNSFVVQPGGIQDAICAGESLTKN